MAANRTATQRLKPKIPLARVWLAPVGLAPVGLVQPGLGRYGAGRPAHLAFAAALPPNR
jgi:hypothetical protein